MFGITRGRLVGSVALVAALGLALGLTFAGDEAAADEEQKTVRAGTYQPQAVFEQYHQTQELLELFHELQADAQIAQQEGDQQKMIEIQMRSQQLQQREQEIMEAFMSDMEQAAAEVAREANVDFIAMEILYSASHISEPTDLTQQIITKLNALAAAAEADDE